MDARKMGDVIADVMMERCRQDDLKKQGKFQHTLNDPELSDSERFVVLSEEIGEVARAIQENNETNLKEELTQVAALACAWLEGKAK